MEFSSTVPFATPLNLLASRVIAGNETVRYRVEHSCLMYKHLTNKKPTLFAFQKKMRYYSFMALIGTSNALTAELANTRERLS